MATQASFTREDMQSLHDKLKTWSTSLAPGEQKALGMVLISAARGAKPAAEVSGYEWEGTGALDPTSDIYGHFGDEIAQWYAGGLPTDLLGDIGPGTNEVVDTWRDPSLLR
jgi:hypothetical protein